jgi:hypothetical protein
VTSSLPQEVRDAFDRFITCEYTTVSARQQPITWPVTPYYQQGGPCLDVTTGLGYPKKADDAVRHPSVSLLFSDPTGSGIDSGIQVLVQGTAAVDDRDLEANRERYFRELGAKLPATRKTHPPKAVRGWFNWYYTRIYVHIRPERIFVWANGDISAGPAIHDAHLEEVRSGHAEEPGEEHGAPAGGTIAWDGRIEHLGRDHPTAVLSWLAPDGFPLSVRVPVRADRASRSVAIEAEPTGLPLIEGRACLTAHRHAPDFTWQQNFQVRGDLVRDQRGWRLVPHRMVGGFELPPGGLHRYRAFIGGGFRHYRAARRRLKARGAAASD